MNFSYFLRSNEKYLILLVIIFGVFLRFYTASFGSNYDFETWNIGAKLIENGESVYPIPKENSWGRFNWGPIWPYTLYVFKSIAGEDRQLFHYYLTFFLTVIDIVLCYFIYKLFGKIPAILYFICPISFQITGFYLQFENIAIMFALIGWYLYLNKKDNKYYYYLSSVLFGLSLVSKHVLILFPIWLLFYEYFNDQKSNITKNILHKLVSYLIFVSSFIIEILAHWNNRDQVIWGISNYVISYKSHDGLSAFSHLIRFIGTTDLYDILNMFLPINMLVNYLPSGYSYFKIIFLITLGISGIFIGKNLKQKILLLPLYFLFFFSFASSLADQYFIIPLLTALIFYKRLETIFFLIFSATFVSTFSLNGISSISNIYHFTLFGHQIPIFPYNLKGVITPNPSTNLFDMSLYHNYYIPQFYMLLMSFIFIYKLYKKEELEISTKKDNKFYLLFYFLFYFYLIFIIIFRKVIVDLS